MKLYLVWNEAKTECVGFSWEESARYAAHGNNAWDEKCMFFSNLGDAWLNIHGDEECTITEIEV